MRQERQITCHCYLEFVFIYIWQRPSHPSSWCTIIYITLSDLPRSTGWGEERRAWIRDIRYVYCSMTQVGAQKFSRTWSLRTCWSFPRHRDCCYQLSASIPRIRIVQHFSVIVSTSTLVLMVAIWLPKRYLARALNRNSSMAGEAACSLSCIQISIILFVGSLIFKLWTKGWWVDSVTALILGTRFGWEGYKMVRPKFRW